MEKEELKKLFIKHSTLDYIPSSGFGLKEIRIMNVKQFEEALEEYEKTQNNEKND